MRILLINPNTTAAMTDKMVAAATAIAPDIAFVGVTGRFGPAYIASRAASAIAGHAALDAFAAHGAGMDAVLLACFGDPGLDALREMADVPVIGLADAACRQAGEGGRRFGIVTGGERWGPMLREFVASRGLGASLTGIRTVAPTGADIARDPEGSVAILAETARACINEDGAQAVILGGAGLVGLAGPVAARLGAPVICSVEAGVKAVIAAARAPFAKPASGDFAPTPPAPTEGLSPKLAARFTRG